jgi:hypothetical protein
MNSIHPKVALPTLAGLGITVLTVALKQYAPAYAPNAELLAAIIPFISGLVGYFVPGIPPTP